MNPDLLKPVNPGDPIRAAQWNEMLKMVKVVSAAGPHTQSGMIGANRRPAVTKTKRRLMQIQAAGPSAEADYSDNRYWLATVYVDNDDDDDTTALTFQLESSSEYEYEYRTGYNLAEESTGSHALLIAEPAGSIVVAWEVEDESSPTKTRLVFDHAPPTFWVKCQSIWSSGSPATVSVKWCEDSDGGGESDPAFNVKIKNVPPGKDPCYYSGDVFKAQVDASGDVTPVEPLYDDEVGAIKIWHSTTPPSHWSLATALASRFIVGYDSGNSDYDAYGKTGGCQTHTHASHPPFSYQQEVDLSGPLAHGNCHKVNFTVPEGCHDYADHRPPFYVVVFIERDE